MQNQNVIDRLRVGELAALTVDDIDMERHIVYINKSCKRYYALFME